MAAAALAAEEAAVQEVDTGEVPAEVLAVQDVASDDVPADEVPVEKGSSDEFDAGAPSGAEADPGRGADRDAAADVVAEALGDKDLGAEEAEPPEPTADA